MMQTEEEIGLNDVEDAGAILKRDHGPLQTMMGNSSSKTASTSIISEASSDDLLPSSFLSYSRDQSASGKHKAVMPRSSGSLHFSSSLSAMTTSFTINKLQFGKLSQLFGRSKELEQLEGILDSACQEAKKEMVLVVGDSGSGKTALARQLEASVVRSKNGLFLSGKFAHVKTASQQEPYLGFRLALDDLCQKTLALKVNNGTGSENTYDGIASLLREQLDQEIPLLVKMVPSLESLLLGENDSKKTNHQEDSTSDYEIPLSGGSHPHYNEINYSEAKSRIQYALRRLVKCLCRLGPLVLMLDDCQWMDPESMELMAVLLREGPQQDDDKTGPSQGLLLIATLRREDDLEEGQCSTSVVEQLCNVRKAPQHLEAASGAAVPTKIHKIELENLEIRDIAEMLSELLSCGQPDVATLATTVHRRTKGNVLHAIRFIEGLAEDDLLKFNFGLMKWTWDDQAIAAKTVAAENVIDLVKLRLTRRLSKERQEILQLLASCGGTIHSQLLEAVIGFWNLQKQGTTEDSHDLQLASMEFAQACVSLDLMELVHSGGGDTQKIHTTYRWCHDKIQEAALECVPHQEGVHDLSKTLFRLALYLMNHIPIDNLLFVLAEHLHQGNSLLLELKDEKKTLQVANLLHSAGKHAMELASFQAAATYFERAILLLSEHHWQDQYALSLDLFTNAAKAECCNGNHSAMRLYTSQILAQGEDRPLSDMLSAHYLEIDALGAEERGKEAVQKCLRVLGMLNCHFPKKASLWSVCMGLWKVQKKLAKHGSNENGPARTMTALDQIATMKLLDMLVTFSCRDDYNLLSLTAFRMVELTLENGVCELSSVAYSVYAMLVVLILGDIAGSRVHSDRAVQLLERFPNSPQESRANYMAHAFAVCWTRPSQDSLEPLLHGYRVGMASGDTTNAISNVFFFLEYAFFTGRSLSTLERDMAVYCRQAEDLQQLDMRNLIADTHRFVQCLQDPGLVDARDAYVRTGRLHGQDKAMHATAMDSKQYRAKNRSLRLRLAYLFGDHERALELLDENAQFEEALTAVVVRVPAVAFAALACFAMARKTGQRKHKKRALRYTHRIKKWFRSGCSNCCFYAHLLEGERLALKGKKGILGAIKQYQMAVTIAGRSGNQQDQALANELCGQAALLCGGGKKLDGDVASHHLSLACELYYEWGAVAKAEDMKKRGIGCPAICRGTC